MSTFLSLLPLAGCGLMMRFCMRGMRGRSGARADAEPAGEVEEGGGGAPSFRDLGGGFHRFQVLRRMRASRSFVGAPLVVAAVLMTLGATACGGDTTPQVGALSGGATGGDFHSLVADPTVSGRIYVGGHTSVSRSDDSGRTWTAVPGLNDADAMGWGIESTAIWVSGHPGLSLSVDGGVTFERRNSGLPDTDVHAFGAAGQAQFAAGPGLGVVGSADGGSTWVPLSSAAGQSFFGRILIDPADAEHLIAADVQNGASESNDGGRTWTPLGTQPASWVSSSDGLSTLFASGGPIAERSRDGGSTWERMTIPDGATLVEATPGALYAGVHEGESVTLWVSADDGITWNRP